MIHGYVALSVFLISLPALSQESCWDRLFGRGFSLEYTSENDNFLMGIGGRLFDNLKKSETDYHGMTYRGTLELIYYGEDANLSLLARSGLYRTPTEQFRDENGQLFISRDLHYLEVNELELAYETVPDFPGDSLRFRASGKVQQITNDKSFLGWGAKKQAEDFHNLTKSPEYVHVNGGRDDFSLICELEVAKEWNTLNGNWDHPQWGSAYCDSKSGLGGSTDGIDESYLCGTVELGYRHSDSKREEIAPRLRVFSNLDGAAYGNSQWDLMWRSGIETHVRMSERCYLKIGAGVNKHLAVNEDPLSDYGYPDSALDGQYPLPVDENDLTFTLSLGLVIKDPCKNGRRPVPMTRVKR